MFSRIFCLIHLIDAFKPNKENNFKFVFLRDPYGNEVGSVQNKTNVFSFRVRFFSGNININHKKRENFVLITNTKLNIFI